MGWSSVAIRTTVFAALIRVNGEIRRHIWAWDFIDNRFRMNVDVLGSHLIIGSWLKSFIPLHFVLKKTVLRIICCTTAFHKRKLVYQVDKEIKLKGLMHDELDKLYELHQHQTYLYLCAPKIKLCFQQTISRFNTENVSFLMM